MLTLEELSNRISDYQSGRIGLSEFENWFEDNSSTAYASPELQPAWIAIDAAFSQYHYDDIGEDSMMTELAKAIVPFVWFGSNQSAPFVPTQRSETNATSHYLLSVSGV